MNRTYAIFLALVALAPLVLCGPIPKEQVKLSSDSSDINRRNRLFRPLNARQRTQKEFKKVTKGINNQNKDGIIKNITRNPIIMLPRKTLISMAGKCNINKLGCNSVSTYTFNHIKQTSYYVV